MTTNNYNELPTNLPVPLDDGACNDLKGKKIPSVELTSTTGHIVDLSEIRGKLVLYFYPMTGNPREVSQMDGIKSQGQEGVHHKLVLFEITIRNYKNLIHKYLV